MLAASSTSQPSQFKTTPSPNNGHTLSSAHKAISAISGAIITSLLVTPLDVVRVRLQSQYTTSSSSPMRSTSNGGIPPRLAFSTFGTDSRAGVTACCREVFFSRGWSGVNGNVVHCEYQPVQPQPSLENGFCAVEETGKRTFRGTWEGLVKIARHEGFTSLWRGLSPTLYTPFLS